MNLLELKQREIGLLNSNKNRFEEYGRACADIREMCENFAGNKLSDDILISDMSKKFIEKEQKLFNLTKNEKHLIRIKLATEFILKEYMPYNELYNYFNKINRIITFEEAHSILEDHILYKKIKPDILETVLNNIKKERSDEIYKNDS